MNDLVLSPPPRWARVGGVLVASLMIIDGVLAEESREGTATAAAPMAEPVQEVKREADTVALARVGDGTITLQQFMETVQADPNLYNTLGSMEERAKLLRRMIEARLLGLAALERAGLPRQGPPDELRAAVLDLERQEFAPDEITDEQVAQAYASRRESLGIPAAVRIREIFFPIPAQADPAERAEVRGRAEEALRRVSAGESFENLATELHFKPGLRSLGGDLGFISVAEFPHLAVATAGMREGDISGILEYPNGYQVFQFLGRREGILVPYEAVKDQLHTDLLKASVNKKRDQFLHDYARKIGVEVLAPELSSAWPIPTAGPAAN